LKNPQIHTGNQEISKKEENFRYEKRIDFEVNSLKKPMEKSRFNEEKSRFNEEKSKNDRFYEEKLKNEEKARFNEEKPRNMSNFDKIRSITPTIERSKLNSMPGSTRSITPLDKGEREFIKPNNLLEKPLKNTDISNNYQNRVFAEINEQNKENFANKLAKKACNYKEVRKKWGFSKKKTFFKGKFNEIHQ